VLISLTFVDELKIIIEYIAGTTLSDTISQEAPVDHHVISAASELPSHHTTLPNLFLSSSIDSHPVINLLNNERGHSPVNTWLQNIVHAVMQAFDQNHILSLV
jgi:hypothetical protein